MSSTSAANTIQIEFFEEPKECCVVTVGEWMPSLYGVSILCFDCGNRMKTVVSDEGSVEPINREEVDGTVRHKVKEGFAIHSLIFHKSSWPLERIKDWLARNSFKAENGIEKIRSFIFPQSKTEEIDMGTLGVLGVGIGVTAVLGKKKDEKAEHATMRSDGTCPPGFKKVGNLCVKKKKEDNTDKEEVKEEVKEEDKKKEEKKAPEVDESIEMPKGGVCPAEFPVGEGNRCLTRKEARRRRSQDKEKEVAKKGGN